MSPVRGRLGRLAILVILTGCAPVPAPPPPMLAPADLDLHMAAPPVAQRQDWWRGFKDPALNHLIENALGRAPNLALARARLDRAQAALAATQSADLPNLSLGAGFDRERETKTGLLPPPIGGKTINNAVASLSLGYDLDLWGRRADLIAASHQQVIAEQANMAAARLYLAASIAQAYYAVATDRARLDYARETEARRRELHEVSEARLAAGKDPLSASLDARAQRRNAKAGVSAAEAALALDQDQLAALCGIARSALPDIPAALHPEIEVPLDALGIDLLSRRPEIAASRALVEAEARNVDAARAAFLPDISLSALGGQSTIELGQFTKPGSTVWSFGPALHLPIFDGGLLRAELGVARADLDAAIAGYNQSLLDAIRETADAYAAHASLSEQLDAARKALADIERQHDQTKAREEAGLADKAALLSADLALLSQRLQVAELEGRRAAALIALEKALGGGVSSPPVTDETMRIP